MFDHYRYRPRKRIKQRPTKPRVIKAYTIPEQLADELSFVDISLDKQYKGMGKYKVTGLGTEDYLILQHTLSYKDRDKFTCFVVGHNYFVRISSEEDLIKSLLYLEYKPLVHYIRRKRVDEFFTKNS